MSLIGHSTKQKTISSSRPKQDGTLKLCARSRHQCLIPEVDDDDVYGDGDGLNHQSYLWNIFMS